MLLAFVWKPSALPDIRNRVRARLLLETAGLLGLAGVLYAFIAVHDYDPATYRGGFLVLAICSAALLAAIVHPRCSLGRLCSLRVPRWIGERSYGIYLWHWPVLAFTRPGVDVHLARGPLALLQAAITVAIAAVSYRFVEQPIRTGGAASPDAAAAALRCAAAHAVRAHDRRRGGAARRWSRSRRRASPRCRRASRARPSRARKRAVDAPRAAARPHLDRLSTTATTLSPRTPPPTGRHTVHHHHPRGAPCRSRAAARSSPSATR